MSLCVSGGVEMGAWQSLSHGSILLPQVPAGETATVSMQHAEGDIAAMSTATIKDGEPCVVTGGTHAGKSGIVRDIHVSKTGHTTVTVVQKNGVRFKTLAKNVARAKPAP